jgi:hypothetical protein
VLHVGSLAVGKDADQKFLCQLSERYGGQFSFVDNKHHLHKTLTGTFFRFFGALSSILVKDAALRLALTPADASVALSDSHLPLTCKRQSALGGCSLEVGNLMSEQRLHMTLACHVPSRSLPASPGAPVGEAVVEYFDLRLKETRRLVLPLSLPVSAAGGGDRRRFVVERQRGVVTLDGAGASHGDVLVLEPATPDRRVATQANTAARLHSSQALLEPLSRCSLRLRTLAAGEGQEGEVLSIVVESGKLYVRSSLSPIEVRRLPGAGSAGEIELRIRMVDITSTVARATPAPSRTNTTSAMATTGGKKKGAREAGAGAGEGWAPAPSGPASGSGSGPHRLFIDASISPLEAALTCLSGEVSFLCPDPVLVPAFSQLRFTRRAPVVGGGAPSPSAVTKRLLLDAMSTPSFAEESLRLSRETERTLLLVLHGLMERERDLYVHKKDKLVQRALEPALEALVASFPHALELALAHVMQAEVGWEVHARVGA